MAKIEIPEIASQTGDSRKGRHFQPESRPRSGQKTPEKRHEEFLYSCLPLVPGRPREPHFLAEVVRSWKNTSRRIFAPKFILARVFKGVIAEKCDHGRRVYTGTDDILPITAGAPGRVIIGEVVRSGRTAGNPKSDGESTWFKGPHLHLYLCLPGSRSR